MAAIDPSLLALIGAILGGSGLKAVEYMLNNSRVKDTAAMDLRNEIRGDLKTCREDRDSAEKKADAWRARYYDLLQDSIDDQTVDLSHTTLRQIDRNDDS